MGEVHRIQKLPVIWEEYAKFGKRWPTVCATQSFTIPCYEVTIEKLLNLIRNKYNGQAFKPSPTQKTTALN